MGLRRGDIVLSSRGTYITRGYFVLTVIFLFLPFPGHPCCVVPPCRLCLLRSVTLCVAPSVCTAALGTALPRAARARGAMRAPFAGLGMRSDALCRQGVVSASGLAATPVSHPLVQGPAAPVSELPAELFSRTARSIHCGRPWDYIVQRGGDRDAPREPTALQWSLVEQWSLYNARGHGLLICNLKRASAKLWRHLVRSGYTHAPCSCHCPLALRQGIALGWWFILARQVLP